MKDGPEGGPRDRSATTLPSSAAARMLMVTLKRSRDSTPPRVEKLSASERCSCSKSERSLTVNSRDRDLSVPVTFTTGGREATREPARPAARPLLQAGSPDRAPSAPRRAHRLDQPSEGLVPSQRKADRKSDRRERTEGWLL